jgi:hypothetical protein
MQTNPPLGGEQREAGQPYDPRTKRGPPQRLEDTNDAGDALNDTGEDNQRCKEEER